MIRNIKNIKIFEGDKDMIFDQDKNEIVEITEESKEELFKLIDKIFTPKNEEGETKSKQDY